MEEDGVLLQLVAAEAVFGRRLGKYVQWLGVGVEEPVVFRGSVPPLQALVVPQESLHEVPSSKRRVVGDREVLPEDGPPLARFRIAAELITMPGRNIAAATSVTREARAGANDLPSVVQAFDRASGEAVQDLIAWAAGNRALSGKGK